MPKAEQSLNELLHEIRRVEKSREVLTEEKIRKIYQQLLKELNHFLADEYLKYSQDGILTVVILQEKSRYAKFLEEIEANINNLTPDIMLLIRKTVENTYDACYKGMHEAVLNAKDTKSALNYLKDLEVRPEVMKRAIENPISGLTLPDILEKNRKEVIYDIKQQVNISLMNGDRYETAAEKLVERLDFSYGKAVNIVRTETHRVTERGFMDCAKDISESLEDSEFVYAAIWHTMKDERVRPQQRYHTKSGWKTSKSRNGANHQKMEGKIIQAGGRFQLEPDVFAECPGNSGTARNDCRCRCFLKYDLLTKEEFVEKGGKLLDNFGKSGIIELNRKLDRRESNIGAFESLEIPMQKRNVLSICKKYSIDTKGITFKIQRSEKFLSMPFYGSTDYNNIGRIDLFPNAFSSEEELVKTILHEKCHVKQLQKFGKKYAQDNLDTMERQAYRFESVYYYILKRKV